jgi:hypothetical protein
MIELEAIIGYLPPALVDDPVTAVPYPAMNLAV